MITNRIIIKGYVQGVGFRYFAKRKAIMSGINGRVRNLDDGSVEVIAQGQKEAFEELLKELKKGPTYSKVEDIKIEEFEDRQYYDFEID
jgi:acylphosphatase